MESQRRLLNRALPVAMEGLRAATGRVEDAANTGADAVELQQALVETLWWQKSIEDLWQEELGEQYYRRRDADAGGLAVGGLAYARNVGGHRVDRTYDEIVYRAASAVESVVIAFDAGSAAPDGLRWPMLDELPPLPMEDPFGRAAMYSEHVAGRALLVPLRQALDFFERLADESSP